MSDLNREIEERGRYPISKDEALEKLKAIQNEIKELDSQQIKISYNPSSLSVLWERYGHPIREALKRINGK